MIAFRRLTTLGVLLITAQVAGAQTPSTAGAGGASASGSFDRRWESFLGCWRPSRGAANDSVQLCIVPSADGLGVRRVTYSGGEEVLAETVIADGTSRSTAEKDCTGSRASRWAASGPRLLMTSTLRCANAPQVTTSGLSVMLSADQWLDVQTIKTETRGEQTRVQRFWRSDFEPPAAVAGVIGTRLPPRVTPPTTTIADVIDAHTMVDPSVLEAWLSEGGIRMPVNRRELLQLSQAKVDGRVIDLMVAMAYPQKFEVRRDTYVGSASGIGMMGDFFPGDWGMLAAQYGLGYGIYGVPYYFGAYGYAQPGGIYFIESGGGGGGATEPATHGQVVNGHGYTRVQVREPFRGTATATSGGTQASAGADSSGPGASSGDGGSSGASPSGYSGGGGGGSTGLTAVPR